MPERPQEGQIAEGGANAHANCVPAEHLAVLQDLGYVDALEPQDITNALFPPDGVAKGGMSFESVVNYIISRPDKYPNLPSIRVLDPPDIISELELFGKMGNPVIIALCVDGPTVLPAHCSNYTIGHALSVVAHLPNDNWIVRNPWSGWYNVINTTQELLSAYEGGITVFGRTVGSSIPNTGRTQNSMLLLPTTEVAPSESVFAVGVYSGGLPDGNWTTFYDVYADTFYGASPVTVQLFYIPADGSAASQLPTMTIQPSVGLPSTNLAKIVGIGGGTLEFRNNGSARVFVTVKREFWRAGW